jgi:hypothetical protein
MKTTITFNGKTFTELNNKMPRMITKSCKCGNRMNIPIAVIVLGIVEDCAHCGKDYPAVAHCNAITEAYKDLIFEGGNISLD